MGMSKVVVDSPTKVRLVHQLNGDGSAYAEDLTVELQPGVDASRLDYLKNQDGKIGVVSFGFSAYDPAPEGLLFPE